MRASYMGGVDAETRLLDAVHAQGGASCCSASRCARCCFVMSASLDSMRWSSEPTRTIAMPERSVRDFRSLRSSRAPAPRGSREHHRRSHHRDAEKHRAVPYRLRDRVDRCGRMARTQGRWTFESARGAACWGIAGVLTRRRQGPRRGMAADRFGSRAHGS
jgi:hypothetical protein